MILQFNQENIEGLETNFLQFQNGTIIVRTVVFGKIINSVPSKNDKKSLLSWKRIIAKSVHDKKTSGLHNPDDYYAISLNMRFNLDNHNRRKLDVENYVKPIVDGIAMGLFANNVEFEKVLKFNEDDSNFHHLYVERSDDVSSPTKECVAIVVSKIKKSAIFV